jgi:hypothetical protein
MALLHTNTIAIINIIILVYCITKHCYSTNGNICSSISFPFLSSSLCRNHFMGIVHSTVCSLCHITTRPIQILLFAIYTIPPLAGYSLHELAWNHRFASSTTVASHSFTILSTLTLTSICSFMSISTQHNTISHYQCNNALCCTSSCSYKNTLYSLRRNLFQH